MYTWMAVTCVEAIRVWVITYLLQHTRWLRMLTAERITKSFRVEFQFSSLFCGTRTVPTPPRDASGVIRGGQEWNICTAIGNSQADAHECAAEACHISKCFFVQQSRVWALYLHGGEVSAVYLRANNLCIYMASCCTSSCQLCNCMPTNSHIVHARTRSEVWIYAE